MNHTKTSLSRAQPSKGCQVPPPTATVGAQRQMTGRRLLRMRQSPILKPAICMRRQLHFSSLHFVCVWTVQAVPPRAPLSSLRCRQEPPRRTGVAGSKLESTPGSARCVSSNEQRHRKEIGDRLGRQAAGLDGPLPGIAGFRVSPDRTKLLSARLAHLQQDAVERRRQALRLMRPSSAPSLHHQRERRQLERLTVRFRCFLAPSLLPAVD